ncbi:hypothetical protein [Curvivirga sp.]|uniref:hypothetical protein n=1 Tax=Curvivirga sp. TaxID=2856848 RepID=UPI003B5B079B
MSEIKVDKVSKCDGSQGVLMDYLIHGTNKAWSNIDAGSGITVRDSFNTSGVIEHGDGQYSYNFTHVFRSSDYVLAGMPSLEVTNGATTSIHYGATPPTAASVRLINTNTNNGLTDHRYATMSVMGELV